ncbi:MAG TPA: ATP-binding protein [Gemmatimonadales bacterium]|nr:ATP-binding protein [Gemmatimonadales bacterium]
MPHQLRDGHAGEHRKRCDHRAHPRFGLVATWSRAAQARLTQAHERELRALLAADLLILDDFGLDAMDAEESRDAHAIFAERHRAGSMIVTSNRGPDEWLATFADPVRAQSAIDRFTSNAYDLIIEGESYRARLKPGHPPGQREARKRK